MSVTMNRNVVVEGLKCCSTNRLIEQDCIDMKCPYHDMYFNNGCVHKLIRDANELLKATVNLCDTCQKDFGACDAVGDDTVFGRGVGNDNVIECAKYKPVITCSECIHADFRDSANPICTIHYGCGGVGFYCADGERVCNDG